MYKLIDNQDRSVLIEGRSRGLGVAFAKRDGKTFVTAYPLTSCKDFCHEEMASEWTGKSYSIYGLKTKPCGLFDTHAYLAFKVLKEGARSSRVYPAYKKEIEQLDTNWQNIQKLLNWFEDRFGVERSEFIKLDDGYFVAKMDLWWVKATYRLSLYMLLQRAALTYDGGDPMTFLNEVQSEDREYLNEVVPKIQRMLDGDRPDQDLNKVSDIHDYGIVNYEFPEPSKPKKSAKDKALATV